MGFVRMRTLLVSPHDDDSCLFMSFICARERPICAVILDSWIQPNRGEIGCSAEERAAETLAAHAILGVETLRCGVRDDMASPGNIREALEHLATLGPYESVYAPAIQGGNQHHDWVGRAALQVFGNIVKQYTTYTRTELWTPGNIEIVPTDEELALKEKALSCYQSQIRINRPHFEAVRGKSEWLL